MTDRVVKVSLAAQVNTYVADMQRAQKGTEKVGTAAEEAAKKMAQQTQAMREVGVSLTAAGAVALAATAIAVKAAIDWETAWTGVTKTVDGSASQMAELEGELRNLAKTLPATHQEIAAVAEAAGQLGVKRADITAFTKTMIDLGETTNLSADEAATSIAQLMNVMGTAPDQVDNLGSAIVALGNDGASTERDIVQMAQRIAGAGRIVGLTEGEVLGFANALASVGIEAEAGGSAVSRIMTDIAMSVSAGGEDLENFSRVAGMSSKEFQKAFKDDPADAIATFVEGLGRINAEGGDVFKTLSDLGQSDIRVSQALLGMANSGDLLRKSLSLGNSALKENTALTDEAAKRYETTASKLQVVGNQINDAAIDFGASFLPAISAVASAIGALADSFGALPEPAQNLIAWSTAAAGAVALMAGGFLLAVPKIAELRIALGVLATSSIPAVATAAAGMQGAMGKAAAFLTGPWGLALAAAAVGVAALDQVMKSMQATAEQMTNAAVTARDANEILRTAFQGAPDGFVWDDGAASIENFQAKLETVGRMQTNFWDQFGVGNQLGAGDFNSALHRVGETLGDLAATDLPSAQRAFQLLAEKTDGSKEQMTFLLNAMPALKAELSNVATDSKRAADDQTLLSIAMEKSKPSSESAAEAYKAAASEASALQGEITSLMDAINAANGVGQDAVSTNARYQESLAGISEEIGRQRDEYEKVNGTLDGFTFNLDENTASGASNAAMLSDVAKNAQDAALAQYEQDKTTMSAKDATDKYIGTLATSKKALEDQAIANGANADQVQALSDKVFALPTQKEIDLLVDTAQAASAIDRFITTYNGRKVRLDVATDSLVIPSRATGGILPGPPSKKDNMLIHAASGEFVVNAAATQRNRALLEQINSGLQPKGYANGGFIQPQYARSSGFSPSSASPSLPPIYIQSPVTGEWLLAKTAEIATGVTRDALKKTFAPFEGGRR